jgi:hypothetical protein
VLARQVLYNFSHVSSPFDSGYFRDRVSAFCPGQASVLAGMTSVHPFPIFFPLRWGLTNSPSAPTALRLAS